MVQLWIVGFAAAATGVGLLFASVVTWRLPRLVRCYPVDVVNAFLNGVVGAAGILLYALNIPIFSRVQPLEIFVVPTVVSAYVVCNTLRFVCWYLEFLCTFLVVTALRTMPLTVTLVRYAVHTANLALSVACFALCVAPSFPSRALPGYAIVPPEVWQSVIAHYVAASYGFILRSPAHRIDGDSAIATMHASFTSPCLSFLRCSRRAARGCSLRG